MSLAKLPVHTLLYLGHDHVSISTGSETQVIEHTTHDALPMTAIEACLAAHKNPIVISVASQHCVFLPLPLIFSHRSWRQPIDPLAQALLKDQQPQRAQELWSFHPWIRGWKKPIAVIGYTRTLQNQLVQSAAIQKRCLCCLPAWAFLSEPMPQNTTRVLYGTREGHLLTWVVMDHDQPIHVFQEHLSGIDARSLDESCMRFRILHPEYAHVPAAYVQHYPEPHSEPTHPSLRIAHTMLAIKSASLVTQPTSVEKCRWVGMGLTGVLLIFFMLWTAYLAEGWHAHESTRVTHIRKRSDALTTFLQEEKPLLNLPIARILSSLQPQHAHVLIVQVSAQWDQHLLSIRAEANTIKDMFDYVEQLDHGKHPDFESIELISHQADTQTQRIVFTVRINMTKE